MLSKNILPSCYVRVEAYPEPNQISETKLFPKIVNGFQSLTIFAKSPILDVKQGSKYVCVRGEVEPYI